MAQVGFETNKQFVHSGDLGCVFVADFLSKFEEGLKDCQAIQQD